MDTPPSYDQVAGPVNPYQVPSYDEVNFSDDRMVGPQADAPPSYNATATKEDKMGYSPNSDKPEENFSSFVPSPSTFTTNEDEEKRKLSWGIIGFLIGLFTSILGLLVLICVPSKDVGNFITGWAIAFFIQVIVVPNVLPFVL